MLFAGLLALAAAASHAGASHALVDPVSLFTTDDYPAEAMQKGEQGVVTVRVGVASDGRVSSCTVTRTSKSPALDARTCAIITERAHYSPAHDRRGRAMASSEAVAVRWVMPSGDVQPVMDVSVEGTVEMNGDTVLSCTARTNPPMAQATQQFCAMFGGLAHEVGGILPAGAPKPTRIVMTIDQLVGDTPPPLPRVEQVIRVAMNLSIDASGKHVACASMPAANVNVPAVDACAFLDKPRTFVPLGTEVKDRGDRHLLYVLTMVFEGADVIGALRDR